HAGRFRDRRLQDVATRTLRDDESHGSWIVPVLNGSLRVRRFVHGLVWLRLRRIRSRWAFRRWAEERRRAVRGRRAAEGRRATEGQRAVEGRAVEGRRATEGQRDVDGNAAPRLTMSLICPTRQRVGQ